MAYYAILDINNIVIQVVKGVDETELIEGLEPEIWYSNINSQVCKRTSYNTKGGQHQYGGIPFRKNYAGIGYTYDEIRDAFIPPKPFNSWILNEDTCLWQAPIPYPNDEQDYYWNEDILNWELLDQNTI